jgi:hypothetical protein
MELAVPTRPACWQLGIFQNGPRLRPADVDFQPWRSMAWMVESGKSKIGCVLAVLRVIRMRNSHVVCGSLDRVLRLGLRRCFSSAVARLFLVLVNASREQCSAYAVLLGAVPELLRYIGNRFSSLEQLDGLCTVQICPSSFANRLPGLLFHFVASCPECRAE